MQGRGRGSFIWLVVLLAALIGCRNEEPFKNSASDTSNANSSSDNAAASDKVDDKSHGEENSTPTSIADLSNIDLTVPKSDVANSNSDSSVEESSDPKKDTTPTIPLGIWTTQRLIAPISHGPIVLDLRLRAGDYDLDTASAKVLEPIVRTLLDELGQEKSWAKLLELPLVKSGWLGNLTGESGTSDQITSLYDKNKDQAIQADELTEFLTRGLSRSAALLVSDTGSEPNVGTESKFGVLDQDNDNVLSLAELDSGAKRLMKLDTNGDSMVTLVDLSPSNPNSAMMTGQRASSMLRPNTLLFEPPATASEQESNRKKLRQRKAAELLEQYSFLGQIEREQWPEWDEQQWAGVDTNSDGQISKSELAKIFEAPPAVELALRIPTIVDQDQVTWLMQTSTNTPWQWSANGPSARLSSSSICLVLEFEEGYNQRARNVLKTQLGQALKNSQLAQFMMQQLQLKNNAIELCDSNRDGVLQDEEFKLVWQWLTARQSTRLQARWMLAARPWFHLLDQDGNLSLSELEIQQAKTVFAKLDTDGDGEVTTNELPIVVKMRVSRTDTRLNLPANVMQAPDNPAGMEDWFAAMDTNQDGNISRQEFLGGDNDFAAADKDSDGYISKREVY